MMLIFMHVCLEVSLIILLPCAQNKEADLFAKTSQINYLCSSEMACDYKKIRIIMILTHLKVFLIIMVKLYMYLLIKA